MRKYAIIFIAVLLAFSCGTTQKLSETGEKEKQWT